MRDWTVGGAVIPAAALDGSPVVPGSSVLLVRNLRRNGTSDWTPPGGVIDGDEGVVAGLAREVREETGLEVHRWSGPIYGIDARAPELGWNLRVEVHLAVAASGTLRTGDDPDGIVVEAAWVEPTGCAEVLAGTHPWVREPLLEWLGGPWEGTREYGYRIDGTHPDDLRVHRTA